MIYKKIVMDNFDEKSEIIKRVAARAIIFNDSGEVLFVHVKHYNDVTFPGGGVDLGESIIEALKRETIEEVGVIIKKPLEYALVDEFRVGFADFNCFTSHYFICEIEGYTNTNLMDYEIEMGYSAKWLKIEEAIKINKETYEKSKNNKEKYLGVLERELFILESLLNK